MFLPEAVNEFGVLKLLYLCNLPVRIEPNQVDKFMSIGLIWKSKQSSVHVPILELISYIYIMKMTINITDHFSL